MVQTRLLDDVGGPPEEKPSRAGRVQHLRFIPRADLRHGLTGQPDSHIPPKEKREQVTVTVSGGERQTSHIKIWYRCYINKQLRFYLFKYKHPSFFRKPGPTRPYTPRAAVFGHDSNVDARDDTPSSGYERASRTSVTLMRKNAKDRGPRSGAGLLMPNLC